MKLVKNIVYDSSTLHFINPIRCDRRRTQGHKEINNHMKKLLTIILLLLTLTAANAQFSIQPQRHKEKFNWEPVKTIGIYASSIALNAVADGLNDNGNKNWAHVARIASYVPLAASPWILKYQNNKGEWLTYITTYVGIRFATFDYIYNSTRGLPLNYFGTTSVHDKVLGQIGRSDGFFAGRVAVISFSLSFTFNNLH